MTVFAFGTYATGQSSFSTESSGEAELGLPGSGESGDDLGLSQEALAREAALDRTYVGGLERGDLSLALGASTP